jgi:hypothetical protein
MSAKVNPREFTRVMGGATLVSARVNQDPSMTIPDAGGLSRAKPGAKAKFTPANQTRLVNAAIKNKRSADDANVGTEISIARTSMRLGILAEIRSMIHARQAHTFKLYATKEMPKVREINAEEGRGDQAVAVLSRIAARINSTGARATLGEKAAAYFPK